MKRVCVVDDDPIVRGLMCRIVSDQGYEVDEAADGQEALERIAASPPDLLILDLHMPRLDGWEVLRRLPRGDKRPKVVIVSSTALDPRAKEFGVEVWLTKPVGLVDLIKACRAAIGTAGPSGAAGPAS